jgi:RNA polymerase sigma-70 factor (ECF subfamily)
VECEARLLSGLLRDEPHAWREFNHRYSRLIYRCITKVLGRFSGVAGADDTREIYSTLCVQLLANDKRKLRSFDPERGNKLSTWLGLLATHAAYDFLRARKRAPKTEDLTSAESLTFEAPTADEICVQREKAALVAELLSSFSDKDREFMTLYFADGLEPEEVAQRMGISVKTVYSKKHKIRSRLEGLLERQPFAA